ncbi:MAG TPA: TonB-dependent receptor [Steroidobacteraceae bacterium]|jgi:iron complex outermembrane receptor protein|nr:TonB-dependent receptor [Steroidobacteraceae bacterium]
MSHANRTKNYRRLGPTCLGLLAAGSVLAADNSADTAEVPTIGEIVVTAQRREESNLQVGLTLTALSGDALAQQRVEQVLDLKGRVPNLDIKEQVPGAMPVITIRGVGLNDFGAANSPSAGVYVDQVYVASIAMMAFDMFDVERIEVLKGPQGTLYGRNSTAGALNIITRKPQQDFDAYATLGYGNYDTLDFETAVNVPLADTAALRFSAKTIQQGEGYWTSRLLPGETIGNRDLTMGRAQLALSPSDSFDLNLKVEGVRSRSEMGQPEFFGTVDPNTGGTCAPILAGRIDNTQCTDFLGYTDTDGDPFKGDWARQGVYDIDNTAVTLTMNADLGAATLTSVSGYVDFDRKFDIDVDATPARELDFLESDAIKQYSQELRLAASGERLDWIVGAFYSKDEVGISIPGGHEDLFLTRTLVSADQDTKSAAGFAHGEWHLTDKLDLVTGLRYTWEERSYVGGTTDLNPIGFSCLLSPTCTPGFVGPAVLTSVDETIDDRNWSWRAGLEYQPAQSALLYATISRGTKSGGFFSGISTTNLQLAPFAPEELTAYEVGFKRGFGNAYVNAAVFYYDYSDIQTFIAVDIGPFIIQRLGNVDDARVYGVDLEATWAPTEHLTLQGSVGWLDAELGAFRTLTGEVPKGNKLPNAPDLTLGALARYETEFSTALGGAIQVDGSYSDGVFKDAINDPVIAQDSYVLVNARVALFNAARTWEVALWGKNLGDEQYVAQGLNTGLGAGNRNYNAPRTYGASFTYRW